MNPVIIEKMWVGETDDQNWPYLIDNKQSKDKNCERGAGSVMGN